MVKILEPWNIYPIEIKTVIGTEIQIVTPIWAEYNDKKSGNIKP